MTGQESRDRPAIGNEVTAEMAEAGGEMLWRLLPDETGHFDLEKVSQLACAVYEAMTCAREGSRD